MPTLTDEQVRTLVERLRAGDQDAARLMVDTYARRLHALAVNKLAPLGSRRRFSADDIVQSVCKSFFRSVAVRPEALHFEVDGDLFGWLSKVTRRKCIKAIERDVIRSPLAQAYDDELLALSAREVGVVEQAILEETIDGLLKDLDDPDKEIASRLLLGFTMTQVADDLKRTFFAVKSVMDRLRREFERMIDRDLRQDGESDSGDRIRQCS